jgi:hypothetical protein
MLWGPTGTGKAVAGMVAMSVWGNPEKGALMLSLNNTRNYFDRVSGFLCDVPFFADELQIVKDRWDSMESLIMYLTEGVSRGRAVAAAASRTPTAGTAPSSSPARKAPSSLRRRRRPQPPHRDRGQEGHKIIPDGNATVNTLRDHHGHAGPAFVSALAQFDPRPRFTALTREILSRKDTTEKQAQPMAAMLLADELAQKILFPDDPRSPSTPSSPTSPP